MEHINKYAEAEMKRIKDAAQANESLKRGKALRHTPLVVPSKAQGEDFISSPACTSDGEVGELTRQCREAAGEPCRSAIWLWLVAKLRSAVKWPRLTVRARSIR